MSTFKRGKIYSMSFVYRGKHIQKSTGCKNKRDADEVERAYRTQLAKNEVGIETKPPAPAFGQAMDEFFRWAEVEHAATPNTLRSYVCTSKPLREFFGNEQIDEIEPGRVEAYKQWRSKQKTKPRRAGSKGRDQSARTRGCKIKPKQSELKLATKN